MQFPFKDLHSLGRGWDSYDGIPPSTETIHKAYRLWTMLGSAWQVCPVSDGSIQLEDHRDGFDLELSVSPAAKREGSPK